MYSILNIICIYTYISCTICIYRVVWLFCWSTNLSQLRFHAAKTSLNLEVYENRCKCRDVCELQGCSRPIVVQWLADVTWLAGGFHPSEKYARQIGSFPQVRGKWSKVVETTQDERQGTVWKNNENDGCRSRGNKAPLTNWMFFLFFRLLQKNHVCFRGVGIFIVVLDIKHTWSLHTVEQFVPRNALIAV